MAKKTKNKSRTKKDGGLHLLIVESRFYDSISDELLRGATRVLDNAGARYDRVTVPGTLEIPAAIGIAMDASRRRRAPYDGVVALGWELVSFPFAFYRAFLLERKYGLPPERLATWLEDHAKALGRGFALTTIAGLAVFGAMALAGDSWWIVGAPRRARLRRWGWRGRRSSRGCRAA